MYDINKLRENFDIRKMTLHCLESELQLVKIANIGGQLRVVPVHGSKINPSKIPAFYNEGSSNYYTYGELYEREYYPNMINQLMEPWHGICGLTADISSINKRWHTTPTAEYDYDAITYEWHTVERITLIITPEFRKK